MSTIATQLVLFPDLVKPKVSRPVKPDRAEIEDNRTLADVIRWLDTIPHLNHGGCGLAALAVHRWLKKQGIQSRIVNLHHSRCPIECCCHAVVDIGGELCDSTGIGIDPENHRDCGKLTGTQVPMEDADMVYLLNAGGWNDEFRGVYWLPKIARHLGVDLSDIYAKEVW